MKDKENFIICKGKYISPNTLEISFGEASVTLHVGANAYNLRDINFSKYEYLVIDGVKFRRILNER